MRRRDTGEGPLPSAGCAPRVRLAMDTMETPPAPSSHMVLRLTSASSSPVTTAYPAPPVRATAEALNPAGAVVAGSARIPAPTVVPATRVMAPSTLPGWCRIVWGSTLDQSRLLGATSPQRTVRLIVIMRDGARR